VRIETPYEKRRRENAEIDGRPVPTNDLLKEKSAEEIESEVSKIDNDMRSMYQQA